MAFCTNCGSQLPDGMKFCTNCGQKLEAPSPAAGEPAAVTRETPPSQPVMEQPPQAGEERPAWKTWTNIGPVSGSLDDLTEVDLDDGEPITGTYTIGGGAVPPPPVQTAPQPEPEHTPPVQTAPQPEPERTPPVQASIRDSVPQPPEQAPTQGAAASTAPARDSGSYVPPVPPPPPAGQAPREKKSGGGKGKIIAIIAVVAIVLVAAVALLGGGGEDADDPNAGLYECTNTAMVGVDLGADGEWIELKSGGSCDVYLLGVDMSGDWALEGETLTVTLEGEEIVGTLSDGVIFLDFWGMECTFEKAGGAPAASEDAEETQEAGEDQETAASGYDLWEGDWYGWWVVYSGHGEYESIEDHYWDVCARIDVDGSDGTIVLWDEDSSAGDPLMEADVSFRSGLTEYGTMTCESGYFDTVSQGHAEWSADPGSSTVTMFDNMVEINFKAPYTEDDWIDVYIFLRPWGTQWEDVLNGDTSGCIYNDMMPNLYGDWYLPLIQAGSAMPDSFE